jgi:putative sugar O-methyltransferase
VLEHVSIEQGQQYLAIIRRDNPQLLDHIERFGSSDAVGGPIVHKYDGLQPMSPTTLRYIKVLSDLMILNGDLTGSSIVEIGPGYGGQAKIICDRFDVASYLLIDLPECLALARRFLQPFDVPLTAATPGALPEGEWDLLISNYAFSECERHVQDSYRDAFVSHARHGYLTCNLISELWDIDSYSADELVAMRPGTRVLPEEPVTFEGNRILVW